MEQAEECPSCKKRSMIYWCQKCGKTWCFECFCKHHRENKLFTHSFIVIASEDWITRLAGEHSNGK